MEMHAIQSKQASMSSGCMVADCSSILMWTTMGQSRVSTFCLALPSRYHPGRNAKDLRLLSRNSSDQERASPLSVSMN